MNKGGYVYMLTNASGSVIYTGVTNNLVRRIHEHKSGFAKGFTFRYNVDKLVYFEIFEDIIEAIKREKQIKGGPRNKKLCLINAMNPEFVDLYEQIV